MRNALCLWALLLLAVVSLPAQNNVGTQYIDYAKAMDGYNLLWPYNQPNVYLINNCGQVINTWSDSSHYRPGVNAVLTKEGKLLKCKRNVSVAGAPIWAGGGGEIVELRDWDNTLLWTFRMSDSLNRLHHDALMLPSGNILMLAWEVKSGAEAIAAGRDTALLPDGELWPDWLIEVKPEGIDRADTIWEWHAWDHLIQDHDSTKANYGVVADHPELIDINLDGAQPVPADWMHANQIDYNEELDQIMICVPAFDEVWIIDHSTSTAQAAGHTGGLSGKGGDLLWRGGKPSNYRSSASQTLDFQHDAHWMDIELPSGHPDRSRIMVFNNRMGVTFSSVDVLTPVFDTYEWEYLMDTASGAFLPLGVTDSYKGLSDFFSPQLSSGQRLPNGNTLLLSGNQGYAREVDAADSIVWEYILPYNVGVAISDTDTVVPGSNPAFSIKRYSLAFPGFVGRTLVPGNYLELNADSSFCDIALTQVLAQPARIRAYPNPAADALTVELQGGLAQGDLLLLDLAGRVVITQRLTAATTQVDLSGVPSGLYLLSVGGSHLGKLVVQH